MRVWAVLAGFEASCACLIVKSYNYVTNATVMSAVQNG
jgi:hypothetical protein